MNIVEVLKEKGLTISTAESVTAGLIAAKICDYSGASNVFKGGIVAYTKEIKCNLLSLNMNDIEAFGVYSEETAGNMALSIKKKTGSDLSIAKSGVAGPGMDENVEAGTVYFGFQVLDRLYTEVKFFSGNRNEVRKQAVEFAINRIIELLEQNE